MRLRYVGPQVGVEIPDYGVVMHGEDIEITGDVAQELLKREDDWKRVDKPRSTTDAEDEGA